MLRGNKILQSGPGAAWLPSTTATQNTLSGPILLLLQWESALSMSAPHEQS